MSLILRLLNESCHAMIPVEIASVKMRYSPRKRQHLDFIFVAASSDSAGTPGMFVKMSNSIWTSLRFCRLTGDRGTHKGQATSTAKICFFMVNRRIAAQRPSGQAKIDKWGDV